MNILNTRFESFWDTNYETWRRKNKVFKNGKEILSNVSYYIKRIDDATGKEYWQLLDKN